MMAASELRSKKSRTTPARTGFQPKTQPWLERLPVELLEQIFLHSLEINMVHALPFLGKRLSKESIYRTLILFAFFEDDRQYPVEQKYFGPATYRVLSSEEQSRLQKGVLESRWCTLSRIRQCLPTLMRLVIVQEWHKERKRERKEQEALAAQDEDHQQRQRPSLLPPLDEIPAVLSYYTADNAKPSPAHCDHEAALVCQHFHRGILNVESLPRRVINPVSWDISTDTNDDIAQPVELLILLWNGHGSSGLNIAPPAADLATLLLGIETAIRERNREALDLLLQIHDETTLCDKIRREKNPISHLPRKILHLATRQGEDSDWILDLLIRYRKGYSVIVVPKDDSVLTKWALQQSKAGSRFAVWLLEVLGCSADDMEPLWRVKSDFLAGRVLTLVP